MWNIYMLIVSLLSYDKGGILHFHTIDCSQLTAWKTSLSSPLHPHLGEDMILQDIPSMRDSLWNWAVILFPGELTKLHNLTRDLLKVRKAASWVRGAVSQEGTISAVPQNALKDDIAPEQLPSKIVVRSRSHNILLIHSYDFHPLLVAPNSS